MSQYLDLHHVSTKSTRLTQNIEGADGAADGADNEANEDDEDDEADEANDDDEDDEDDSDYAPNGPEKDDKEKPKVAKSKGRKQQAQTTTPMAQNDQQQVQCHAHQAAMSQQMALPNYALYGNIGYDYTPYQYDFDGMPQYMDMSFQDGGFDMAPMQPLMPGMNGYNAIGQGQNNFYNLPNGAFHASGFGNGHNVAGQAPYNFQDQSNGFLQHFDFGDGGASLETLGNGINVAGQVPFNAQIVHAGHADQDPFMGAGPFDSQNFIDPAIIGQASGHAAQNIGAMDMNVHTPEYYTQPQPTTEYTEAQNKVFGSAGTENIHGSARVSRPQSAVAAPGPDEGGPDDAMEE